MNNDRVRLRRAKYNLLVNSYNQLIEIAKKGINPNCKNCGGTGYICLKCEEWSKNILECKLNPKEE